MFTKSEFGRLPPGWALKISSGIEPEMLRSLDQERIYFSVPDIHGRDVIAGAVIDLLEHLEVKRAVLLGDYIDRYDHSRAVVDMIMDAKKRNPFWCALRGNHEQMFIDAYIAGISSINGDSFFDQLNPSDRKYYAAIFAEMPVFHETEHLLFVHGGIFESYLETDFSKISAEELLWSYGTHPWYRGKKIVRGHDPVGMPREESNNIGLETCGWRDGGTFHVGIVWDVSSDRNLLGWLELDTSSLFTNEIQLS